MMTATKLPVGNFESIYDNEKLNDDNLAHPAGELVVIGYLSGV